MHAAQAFFFSKSRSISPEISIRGAEKITLSRYCMIRGFRQTRAASVLHILPPKVPFPRTSSVSRPVSGEKRSLENYPRAGYDRQMSINNRTNRAGGNARSPGPFRLRVAPVSARCGAQSANRHRKSGDKSQARGGSTHARASRARWGPPERRRPNISVPISELSSPSDLWAGGKYIVDICASRPGRRGRPGESPRETMRVRAREQRKSRERAIPGSREIQTNDCRPPNWPVSQRPSLPSFSRSLGELALALFCRE